MELRLGTFNVWGLPQPFADDLSARTRVIANRLPELDLDVLLIQEAWSDEIRDGLRRGAEDAGFNVALASRQSGGGLLVISRLPILSNRFEKFHFRGDPERVAQGEFIGAKGYQSLVLAGDDGPIHVVNTHLHARYRRFQPTLNSAVRTAQILQLIGEVHRLEGTVLVGGDFNCTEEDPEYRIFRGLTGCIEVAEGRNDLSTISRSNYYKRRRSGEDKRIDYLFHRRSPRMHTVSDNARVLFGEREEIHGTPRSLSDHFGVSARIAWHPVASERTTDAFPPHDREAFELAYGLLDIGHLEANRREVAHLRTAGTWVAGAVLAANLQRDPALGRRDFLRGSIGALALGAVASALGYTTLARFDSDSKRDAFDDAREVLAQLESTPTRMI